MSAGPDADREPLLKVPESKKSWTEEVERDWRRYRPPFILAVVVIFSVSIVTWRYWPEPGASPRKVFALELQSITNLQAAPSAVGDWWFEQTPWLTPAMRSAIAEAINNPADSSLNQRNLHELEELLSSGRVNELSGRLRTLRQSIAKSKFGKIERSISTDLEQLTRDAGIGLIGRLVSIELVLEKSERPFERHLLAVVRHRLGMEIRDYVSVDQDETQRRTQLQQSLQAQYGVDSLRTSSEYFDLADEDYETAQANYAADDPLRALLLSDYARLRAEKGEVKEAAELLQQALSLPVHTETIFARIGLQCQQATLYRSAGELQRALAALSIARSFSDQQRSSVPKLTLHPMRLLIDEHFGWVYLDMWRVEEAAAAFRRYDAGLAGQVREPSDDWNDRLQLYSSRAHLGLAQCLHFKGEQQEAIDHLEAELATLATNNDQLMVRRQSLLCLAYLADVLLFGQKPDPSAALAAFRRFNDIHRELSLAPEFRHAIRLRECLALAAVGRLKEARVLFARIDNETNPDVAILAKMVATLCDADLQVGELLGPCEQAINDAKRGKLRLTPEVVQLLLVTGERIATSATLDGNVELILENLITQCQLLELVVERFQVPALPFARRYLDYQVIALASISKEIPQADLEAYTNRLDKLLALAATSE